MDLHRPITSRDAARITAPLLILVLLAFGFAAYRTHRLRVSVDKLAEDTQRLDDSTRRLQTTVSRFAQDATQLTHVDGGAD